MRLAELPFVSIQGEGPYVGRPSLFIRLQGCNLKPPCAWCDTAYALSKTAGEEIDTIDLFGIFKALRPQYENVVITGGEPFLFQHEIVDIHRYFYERSTYLAPTFEIETNGSLAPDIGILSAALGPGTGIRLSPKYAHHDGIVPRGASNIVRMYHDIQRELKCSLIIKLVAEVTDISDESVNWLETILKQRIQFLRRIFRESQIGNQLPQAPIYIMPLGATQEEQLNVMELIADFCLKNSYRFSPRLHTLIWGNVRGK